MAFPQNVKALLFDVFGTVVDWRTTVTHTLNTQAHTVLNSATASIASSARMKASEMTIADWGRFAQEWRNSYMHFVRAVATDPTIPFKTIDEHHLDSLRSQLSDWGLEGLWTEEVVVSLSLVWHYLDPWKDSAPGLAALNSSGLQTATLSNGNLSLLTDLSKHGSLPFNHLFSGEMFNSYKPSPKVYLGAVEKLGLQPNECAMVAAHLGDLKAAAGCGLRTIYVERPMEEGWGAEQVAKAKEDGWVDLWVSQEEEGFLAVNEKLRHSSRM